VTFSPSPRRGEMKKRVLDPLPPARGAVASGKSKVHCIIGETAGYGRGRAFGAPEKLRRPAGAKKEKRRKDSSLSSAFHGLRVGPQGGRAAPPAATFRSPVGAETAYAGSCVTVLPRYGESPVGEGLPCCPAAGINMGSVPLPSSYGRPICFLMARAILWSPHAVHVASWHRPINIPPPPWN
jgi:hypothetical protein